MLLIFTGNGKGKTTAALGQAMRALGDDKRVLVIQFVKGPWKSGEDFLISKIKNQKSKLQIKDKKLLEGLESLYDMSIIKGGLGFVGILGDKYSLLEHKKAAEETWILAKTEILSGDWDLVILDEINNALHLKLLNIDEVVDFFKKFRIDSALVLQGSAFRDVILTGRDASVKLIELADLVTEMREIKHPYQKGEEGKKGMEY